MNLAIYILFGIAVYTSVIVWNVFHNGLFITKYNDFASLSTLLYIPFLMLSVAGFIRVGKKARMRLWVKFAIGFCAMSAFLIVGPAIVIPFISNNNTGFYIMFSAWCAVAGWFLGHYITVDNARKAHTLNILMQMRNSSEFTSRYMRISRLILDKYPGDISNNLISGVQKGLPKDVEFVLKHDISYISAYYEFICAGYQTNDLDEKLLIRSMRNNIITWVDRFKMFIGEERILPDGTTNPRIYEQLEKTANSFRLK